MQVDGVVVGRECTAGCQTSRAHSSQRRSSDCSAGHSRETFPAKRTFVSGCRPDVVALLPHVPELELLILPLQEAEHDALRQAERNALVRAGFPGLKVVDCRPSRPCVRAPAGAPTGCPTSRCRSRRRPRRSGFRPSSTTRNEAATAAPTPARGQRARCARSRHIADPGSTNEPPVSDSGRRGRLLGGEPGRVDERQRGCFARRRSRSAPADRWPRSPPGRVTGSGRAAGRRPGRCRCTS